MKSRVKAVLVAVSVAISGTPARAVQLQETIQGWLKNSAGTPITTQQTVDFKVYQGGNIATAGSGTLVYEETGNVTPMPSGVFNYTFGAGTPIGGPLTLSAFDSSLALYLEISVAGLIPASRIQLNGSPYAAISGIADNLRPNTVLIIASGTVTGTFSVSGGIIASTITVYGGGGTVPSIATSSGGVFGGPVVTPELRANKIVGDISNTTGQLNTAVTVDVHSLVNGPLPPSMIPSGTGGTAPIGTMFLYAGSSEPTGWIECDGRAVPQNGTATASWGSYSSSSLFAAIGTVWGSPGAGQFLIPDMRGMLPRGWNHGKTGAWSDPDAAGRAAQYASGATGDTVGSYQKDQMPDHTHNLNMYSFGAGTSNWSTIGSLPSAPTGGINTITGSETRAKNASVMYLIRVQ